MTEGRPDRIVTMPPCPSTNALWVRAPGKPRVRSEAYREWAARAGWYLRQQLVACEPIYCRFNVLIEVPITRRDTGNWEKAVMDLCEDCGLFTNDGNAHEITIRPVERTDVMVALWCLPGMGGVRKPAAPRGRGARRETARTIRKAVPGLTWLR